MQTGEIERMILHGLPGAQVEVRTEDGRHYQASVVSEAFRGKSRVVQHQMVYQTLGEHLGGVLHALQLTTSTPE